MRYYIRQNNLQGKHRKNMGVKYLSEKNKPRIFFRRYLELEELINEEKIYLDFKKHYLK